MPVHPYYLLLLFFCWTITSCNREISNHKDPTPIIRLLKSYTKRATKQLHIPGAAVAIVTPEKILSLQTYGVQKLGNPAPINANTVFRIASLSKGLTSALALKLSKKGIVDLQTPIIGYFPPTIYTSTWPFSKAITLKHILSHTSGIDKYFLEYTAYRKQPYWELMGRVKYGKQTYPPGALFQYQNVIFSLIDPIINQITGKSFNQLMQEEVLFPLGMHNTHLTEQDYNACSNTAYPHQRKQGKYHPIPLHQLSYYYNIVPAGGIASSITDMAKWLQALLGGGKSLGLTKKELKLLFTPLVDVLQRRKCFNQKCALLRKSDLEEFYALGWYTQNYYGNRLIFHGGILNGFKCQIAFSPTYNIGMVVLTNGGESHLPELLTTYFFDLLLGYRPDNNLLEIVAIEEGK